LKKNFSFKRDSNQKRKEIKLSLFSSVIFGIGFFSLYKLWTIGHIKLAHEGYPFWYHILSVLLALLLHETYYYWLHRLMHHKKFYKLLHKGHHDSIEVSSWTSFAFDPLETIFQVLPFFIIIFLIPLHIISIFFLLMVMSISAVINHLNYEIYPKFFRHCFPFNQLIGATHHALHHKEFKTNYGLYFTFWDRWMKTQSKEY
jgi:sterol desaturase/sphingolipid hydroxylase (fatty acid hydroxylase superfamily)